MDKDDSKKSGFEGTMVDLGEDLLEPTRAISSSPSTPSPEKPDADEFQRGEILMSERLFDDAKKIFRKLLRKDPRHASARSCLEEIQKQEIQDLLGGEAPRKKLGESDAAADETTAAVLLRWEKELHLFVDKAEAKVVPDLFPDETERARYRESVLKAALALPARERIDIGVAHLEMGLFDVAQEIFETIMRYEEYRLVGMYLLGVALIHAGKAIEATIRLEPIARDLTLGESEKTDFLYLMGLAFERLGDARKAREFYRRAYLLNPRYRDVADKLK